MIWEKLPVFIDDLLTTLTTVWSSQKVNDEIEAAKAELQGQIDNIEVGEGGGISAWTDTTAYDMGDLVSYNYTIYRCQVATTVGQGENPVAAPDKWEKIDGVNYNPSALYKAGDVVNFGGSLYKCIQAGAGHAPTDTAYWTPYNFSVAIGRPVYIFDTQAEMIACTALIVGDRCKTLGYAAVGDDGGADYVVASAADAAGKVWALLIDKVDQMDPECPQLYAMITNTDRVTYKMWGAPLNGIDDDGPAMRKAHKYADSVYTMDGPGNLKQYMCKVENHEGKIYKKDNECINFCSDIDLSGSTIIVDDINAAWFGIYVWGDVDSLTWDFEVPDETKATLLMDNFVIQQPTTSDQLPQNCVLKIEEDPYTSRDDSGYLYTVARRELLIHDANGICSSPLTDDWNHAGGEEINCQLTDLEHGGYINNQAFSKFSCSYTFIPNKHGLFVGCDVEFRNTDPNKYCSVVWVKRHNATIRDFVFRPNLAALHNTAFKNTMVYLWDSYNVRVQNLQGFNAAGQKLGGANGTSGYMLRATNCSDVYVEDCRMQGYWGVTAMDSVKNIFLKRCHMNRLDTHDYFANLYAEDCTFYNHGIQIGYGRGVSSFTNCNFFWNDIVNDSWPNAHMVELDCTYGRVFEGTIYLDNCRVYARDIAPDNEFVIVLADFWPNATSITKHFKFPEVIVRDCQIYSNDSNTFFAGFKITGTRRCTTGSLAPSHRTDYSNDNTVTWHYIGRGVNWGGTVNNISVDSILRVSDSFLDEDKKTQFYNVRYYRCTQAGTLDWGTKPTDKTGTPFTCGTATLIYMPDALWQSKHAYSVGDVCATNPSNWYPLYIFMCTGSGTSNGYYPTHISGTVLEGINDAVNEPNECWWTYVGAKAGWCTDWTPNMTLTNGQRIMAEGRIYECTRPGTLIATPPYDTFWFGVHDCGTAQLKFIGQQWKPKAWYARDSYCEAGGRIYQLSNHDGTTSGVMPVRGNPNCVDGDHIWEFVSTGTDATAWQANTAYNLNDQVTSNGNIYKCVFDGKLTLPNRTVFENITTNMTSFRPFWFYTGNDIPTRLSSRGVWAVTVINCDGANITPYGVQTYFGHSGNPAPVISTGDGGGEIGPAGADGEDGKSAYEVWLELGNTGTEADFLAAIKGDTGAAGADGEDGAPGIAWQDAWSSGSAYAVHDAVSYGGSSYLALVAHTGVTPGTDPTKWALLAQKGTDGGGAGDMTKLIYDTNDDGKVNAAEQADLALAVNYIDLTIAPSDGEALLYDGTAGKFKPGEVSSGGSGVDVATVIASLPAHYQRDAKWTQGSARTKLLSPTNLTVNIGGNGCILTSAAEIDLNAAELWDTTATDFTVAANRAGKDFYIYACKPASGNTPVFLISDNSSNPEGYTAATSRKIGGFHCLCLAVGTISGHSLSGYEAGDILPASIWDLYHRPVCSPEGMVYSEQANLWADIYLQSGTGSSTASVYGAAMTVSRNWMNIVDDLAAVKKRLLDDGEFQVITEGSNQQTNINGGSKPATNGGHVDTSGRRMISNIGCEDCCGAVWQWLKDQAYRFNTPASHTHAVVVTGEAETATSGAPSAEVTPTWSYIWLDGNKGRLYAQGDKCDVKLIAGGNWGSSFNAGSRARYLAYDRSMAITDIGARGCAAHKEAGI